MKESERAEIWKSIARGFHIIITGEYKGKCICDLDPCDCGFRSIMESYYIALDQEKSTF